MQEQIDHVQGVHAKHCGCIEPRAYSLIAQAPAMLDTVRSADALIDVVEDILDEDAHRYVIAVIEQARAILKAMEG